MKKTLLRKLILIPTIINSGFCLSLSSCNKNVDKENDKRIKILLDGEKNNNQIERSYWKKDDVGNYWRHTESGSEYFNIYFKLSKPYKFTNDEIKISTDDFSKCSFSTNVPYDQFGKTIQISNLDFQKDIVWDSKAEGLFHISIKISWTQRLESVLQMELNKNYSIDFSYKLKLRAQYLCNEGEYSSDTKFDEIEFKKQIILWRNN